jgi:hypothetical protein
LTSDISSSVPYLIYMYFHSFVSVWFKGKPLTTQFGGWGVPTNKV